MDLVVLLDEPDFMLVVLLQLVNLRSRKLSGIALKRVLVDVFNLSAVVFFGVLRRLLGILFIVERNDVLIWDRVLRRSGAGPSRRGRPSGPSSSLRQHHPGTGEQHRSHQRE
jgi:hypothetical protein